MTRKSPALYYFTNGRPAEETCGEHDTLFQPRRHETLGVPLAKLARRVAHEVLPPPLSRQLKCYL
jgi:hypothetical protein